MTCHITWAVKCDCCDKQMPGIFSWQEQGMRTAEKAGWLIKRDYTTVCPECQPKVQDCPHCKGEGCIDCRFTCLVLRDGVSREVQVASRKVGESWRKLP